MLTPEFKATGFNLQGQHLMELPDYLYLQVHGHDFFGAVSVPTKDGSFILASCSEEKVIRVFNSPRIFHEALSHIHCQIPPSSVKVQALGARVKALGLTNLSVYEEGENSGGNEVLESPQLNEYEYADGPDYAPTSTPVAIKGRHYISYTTHYIIISGRSLTLKLPHCCAAENFKPFALYHHKPITNSKPHLWG